MNVTRTNLPLKMVSKVMVTKIKLKRVMLLLLLLLSAILVMVVGQEAPGQSGTSLSNQKPEGYMNLPVRTAGGMQFWTDLQNVSGWRIQQNSETGHCRLIDPKLVRRAWGNFAHCQQSLQERVATGQVVQPSGQVVILLHGLVRTSNSMDVMEKHLQGQGYTTVNFGYASSRKPVRDHAVALKSVIDGLGDQVTDIYFVAHSLGNIVIRRYLQDTTDSQTGLNGDPRIRRTVMLGPPNQGSKVARTFENNHLFRTCAGKCGEQLAGDWGSLSKRLATPSGEFGIIAGGQENAAYSNFLLEGKDDYTVSVEETKLPGASDFMVHPLLHGTMMNQPVVLEATTRFFKHGYFNSAAERTPLKR